MTDKDLTSAENCFPGIVRFYLSLPRKPQTFLELVWAYESTRKTLARAA